MDLVGELRKCERVDLAGGGGVITFYFVFWFIKINLFAGCT